VSWPQNVHTTIKRLNSIKRNLKGMFIGRDKAIDLLVLATVCQEHLLFIGPPGTAKTAIINRYTELVESSGFNYLLTRFTEPSELFGPLDLEAFQKGIYTIRTEGMLPESKLVFLDEIFQGSSAILNSLLPILNERIFFNGSQRQSVPLICMIAASNNLPDDPMLKAFGDRFTLRLEIHRVGDDEINELLIQGWELERERIESFQRVTSGQPMGKVLAQVKLEEVLALHGRLLEVDMSRVKPEYGQLLRELRAEGVDLSDRRVVKGMKLIAGAALLRGATIADVQDLWPLFHMWDRTEEASVIQSVIQTRLTEAGIELGNKIRFIAEIMMDLETLEAQEALLSSESAVGASLMALNKLRHELIMNHPSDKEACQRVESVIQRHLQRLESIYV
jgi:MoxR-like ATPase